MIEITSLCGQISLGKQGENLARMVCFDEPAMWKETFGEGKCELVHQRSGDEAPYPVVLNVENDKVSWKITNADTAIVGDGKCELHYIVDNVVVKSKIWTTTVLPSLGGAVEEAPEPQKAWVDQVLNAAEEVEKNAQMVENATVHQPFIGENKNWFVWNIETQEYIDTGILAEGKKGDAGFIKFIPVKELPTENIDVNAIYLVPAKNVDAQNNYEEFVNVYGVWESLGTVPVEVDLSDYVKNTQFADNQGNPGILRLNSNYGISSGRYGASSPATGDTIIIQTPSNGIIKQRTNCYQPITPSNIDYAVLCALAYSKRAWTEAEKQAAKNLLGVIDINNKIIAEFRPLWDETTPIAYGKLVEGKTYEVLYESIGYGTHSAIVTAKKMYVPTKGTTVALDCEFTHPMGDIMHKYIYNNLYVANEIEFYEYGNYDGGTMRFINVKEV